MDCTEIADVLAIQRLKASYFRYLDTKQWDRWRALFTDDLVYYSDHTALPTTQQPTPLAPDYGPWPTWSPATATSAQPSL